MSGSQRHHQARNLWSTKRHSFKNNNLSQLTGVCVRRLRNDAPRKTVEEIYFNETYILHTHFSSVSFACVYLIHSFWQCNWLIWFCKYIPPYLVEFCIWWCTIISTMRVASKSGSTRHEVLLYYTGGRGAAVTKQTAGLVSHHKLPSWKHSWCCVIDNTSGPDASSTKPFVVYREAQLLWTTIRITTLCIEWCLCQKSKNYVPNCLSNSIKEV